MTMTKDDMAQIVAEQTGCSGRAAKAAVEKLFTDIGQTLAGGDEVMIYGFGRLSVTSTSERSGRNPRTGEAITLKAGRKVKFRAGNDLRRALAA